MWCIKATQIVHSNLCFISDFTFSVNYVEHHNISQYALDRNVLWCVLYCKEIPTPTVVIIYRE